MQENPNQPPQNMGVPGPTSPISFDALSVAFKAIQSDIGFWVVATLITMVVGGAIWVVCTLVLSAIGLGAGFAAAGGGRVGNAVSMPIMLIGYLITLGLVTAATYAILAGFLDASVRKLAGEKVVTGDLFIGFKKLSQLLVAGLVIGICTVLGSYLCVIPGLYLGAAWCLTPLLIVRQNMQPFDAMRKSMETITRGGIWMMILLLFVAGICAELGAIACGIGVLFTFAIYPLTIAYVYRGFFPND